ncbi:alpha/beta hydrolase family protein [Mucilaginibacter gynuensis]|uniref:alpha/beta hydrolase family protein n=1 Tax=Mucilaginibacter gynuensis TaxID=1302236 RepID=UPI0031ECFD72
MTLTAVFSCKDNSPEKIPIRDFFKTPEKTFYKISPDGKYVSYLKAYKSKQNLFIQSLADGKGFMATNFSDNSVNDYFWTYNNQIIFSQDVVATDSLKMFVMDMRTLRKRTIIAEHKVKFRLLNRSRATPDVITVSMNKRDEGVLDIYRLNINTGALTLYIQNPGDVTEWFPDENGKIKLARASDGVNATILYRKDDFSKFKPIIINNFKDAVKPVAFTGKGELFYALSNVNRDKMALVEIDALTGKQTRTIYQSDKADVMNVEYYKTKHRLDYLSWDEAKPQKKFFNDSLRLVYNRLSSELKGNEIRVVDRDTAENKFIVLAYSDHNPGSYFLYDKLSGQLKKLGDINSSLNAASLCDMKPIAYKASDGLLINGYLTLPQGKKQTNLPLVVMPHSGPWARSTWGYNADVQFLANRGYAVLQVNFRGSSGYGKAFQSAGYKQVGGKIQQDITDGVKWLIAQNIANGQKVAIYGSGFGGFSALYGVSFNPDLYKCAVVQNGLINFFTFIKDTPPFFKPYLKMTYEMVGNPETDAEQLRAISPVFHTDKIKVPLMIFQGAKDPRANITELNQFVLELRKKNVPVSYFLKDNERGYFKSEANRLEMYTEIEKFLSSNLGVRH